jgi:hypothetical protein
MTKAGAKIEAAYYRSRERLRIALAEKRRPAKEAERMCIQCGTNPALDEHIFCATCLERGRAK